jgi:7,8-dihydropterin-6-yl-methyl-4-(beta-D-ribofuranosyl)aminobenzene 5'-phosphate synthase
MCTDDMATAYLHQPDPRVLNDFEPRVVFGLEPVDSVTVTMLMDNVTDAFMPDQGRPTGHRCGDAPEVPLADGGFSVLVDVAKNGARHRILFDAGTTPDGVVENMRRLGVDPSAIETIICSHGHFDHTAGLDSLIRRLRTVSLPVLIHPHFWRQRRLSIPGRGPQEIPTTSRRALVDAGFEVIEDQQPSFHSNRSVLVTGEVPRTTGYEAGFPLQQAWLDGRWQPDPLVLDDQALIVDLRSGLLTMGQAARHGSFSKGPYSE